MEGISVRNDIILYKATIKEVESHVEKLKNIVDSIDNTLSSCDTSLPFIQNNRSGSAGVAGSVRDNSYYNWISSLRR